MSKDDSSAILGRRAFLAGAAVTGIAGVVAASRFRSGLAEADQGPTARLRARPHAPGERASPGHVALGPATGENAFLYVPGAVAGTDDGVPVVVMLHGASRTLPPVDRLIEDAEARGVAVVVPMAAEHTWDLMAEGRYGGDVGRIDAALDATFERVPVDASRICLAGFSDGASYALSVGLQNGDLITHVIAFSPGFIGPGRATGAPRVFISHGDSDRILPRARTTDRILRSLELRSLEVRYFPFEGGHQVPADAEAAALDWLLQAPDAGSAR